MVAVSLYCIGRLVVARRWDRQNHADVNVSHVLMGAGMAGMLVPAHNPISSHVGAGIFGLVALWFLVRSGQFVAHRGLGGYDEDGIYHLSHYAIHMIMAGAMIFMYLVGTPTAAGGGASTGMVMSQAGRSGAYSTLSFLFIVVLLASAVWQFDGISRFAPSGARVAVAGPAGSRSLGPSAGPGQMLAPRLEIACHIAMAITMGYMLVIML
jgi:hypothetical protein